jgi:hypothetical protein
MDAGNWHGLAVRALRKAEAISPAAARSPGAQRLAAIVAARSGDARVFTTVPNPDVDPPPPGPGPKPPPPPPPPLSVERDQPFVDPRVAETAAVLAAAMLNVPALRGQGLSLQGDLQRSRGQIDAARKTYNEVAAIRMTPSISSRLLAVTKKPT